MAKPNLMDALDSVESNYSDIVEIANDMICDLVNPVNNLISAIGTDINSYSIDQLKEYLWTLQHHAYKLSEVKEKSVLKADLAEALRKEQYANKFNEAQGSAAVKDNIALIESSSQIVVEALYNLIASSLKTKVDQIHRLVDCLKSILMTRMQEAKLSITNIE